MMLTKEQQDTEFGKLLQKFWDGMVEEETNNGYCQASCYKADFLVELGFLHDYGDGVYHSAEKGRIWATVPYHNKFGIRTNWEMLASDIRWALHNDQHHPYKNVGMELYEEMQDE